MCDNLYANWFKAESLLLVPLLITGVEFQIEANTDSAFSILGIEGIPFTINPKYNLDSRIHDVSFCWVYLSKPLI